MRQCNNGSCENPARWMARGTAATGTEVVLYACDGCRDDETPGWFGTSWERLEEPTDAAATSLLSAIRDNADNPDVQLEIIRSLLYEVRDAKRAAEPAPKGYICPRCVGRKFDVATYTGLCTGCLAKRWIEARADGYEGDFLKVKVC